MSFNEFLFLLRGCNLFPFSQFSVARPPPSPEISDVLEAIIVVMYCCCRYSGVIIVVVAIAAVVVLVVVFYSDSVGRQ